MSIVIGITGGIGSGKSTIAAIMAEKLSAPIIDADKIAKEAYKSQEIIKKIKTFFGEKIFDNTSVINLSQLSNIVFSDEKKLLELNNIIHPYVMDEIINLIAELTSENKYIILDVPLPNETFVSICNKIVVVTAPIEIKISRVMKRSNLSRDSVIKRIEKQLPQDKYAALADYIIENSSDIDALSDKINHFIKSL